MGRNHRIAYVAYMIDPRLKPDGVISVIPVDPARTPVRPTLASASGVGSIIGNQKSQIYHLSMGCPS